MPLQLKTTCAPNPRIQPLVDGEVEVPNVRFDWNLQPVPLLFRNNIANDDMEFSEMSISETLLTLDRKESHGNGRWSWWALPIFLSRGHFWGGMYVNASSGIQDLSDLKGKHVGIPDYCMTAALWMRATLKDLYGIETSDIAWHNTRPPEESQAVALELDKDPPPGVTVHWQPKDDPIAMIERGELDAAIGMGGPRLQESSKVRKLMPDDGKEVIAAFFKKTGCFQPNHHFIIQRSLINQEPGAAMNLFSGFEASKQRAYENARRQQAAYLYFEGDDFRKQAETYGEDPYPLGLNAMRKTLERAVQASLEQGLIRRPVKLEDVYHPDTLTT
jgi:4,5-dihydroxyphthalate decarboxylase